MEGENRVATKKSKRRVTTRTASAPKTRKSAASRAAATAAPKSAAATAAAGAPPRLARVARGRKPQYFSDPAIDKLLWMTITLMEELSVARERLDTVERLLDRKKLLRIREIEIYAPDAKAEAERDARRADYVDRVLRIVQAELDELDGKQREAEALEAVGG